MNRRHQHRRQAVWITAAFAGLFLLATSQAATWDTIVSGSSFNSVSAFTSAWSYDYPWGTDHNGSARMNATNVVISNGMVTLISSLTNAYEGTSSSSPYLTIRYNSGTFYLKQQITVSSQYPVWDISGQFKVPAQTGCWPAFWMTGVNSWPPESDFMEFKGSAGCNQNTYNGSWQTHATTVSTASSAWHTYRVVACLENSTNVDFHYFVDGVMESEQTSTTFVSSPCWMIIDFQMEGSSGSPGPSYTTYTYVTNIVVKRLNVGGSGSGLLASGAYRLLTGSTGQALDVGNQDTANGSPVDQWPYNAGFNQQWILNYLGAGQYAILGRQSGRALQVANAAVSNGAAVNIMDYTNGSSQKWTLVAQPGGYYTLLNLNSADAMEVAGNSPNELALIDQWSPAGSAFPLITNWIAAGASLVLGGSGGVPGNAYSLMSSPDLSAPGPGWTPLTALVCDQAGNFSWTNGTPAAMPQQFFRLQLQSLTGASNQQWQIQPP
jgi:hypothetical protein